MGERKQTQVSVLLNSESVLLNSGSGLFHDPVPSLFYLRSDPIYGPVPGLVLLHTDKNRR